MMLCVYALIWTIERHLGAGHSVTIFGLFTGLQAPPDAILGISEGNAPYHASSSSATRPWKLLASTLTVHMHPGLPEPPPSVRPHAVLLEICSDQICSEALGACSWRCTFHRPQCRACPGQQVM